MSLRAADGRVGSVLERSEIPYRDQAAWQSPFGRKNANEQEIASAQNASQRQLSGREL